MSAASIYMAAAVALTGCASNAVSVRWVKADAAEIVYACRAKTFERVWGCSKPIGNLCVVYTDNAYPNQEELLGHEVRHCFDGAFHK